MVWTLTCDPPGGTHPKAKAACDTLARTDDPFAETPPGQQCTMIYGGPEVAMVKGRWHGRPVNTTFSRKNGCELNRWGKIASLFGEVSRPR